MHSPFEGAIPIVAEDEFYEMNQPEVSVASQYLSAIDDGSPDVPAKSPHLGHENRVTRDSLITRSGAGSVTGWSCCATRAHCCNFRAMALCIHPSFPIHLSPSGNPLRALNSLWVINDQQAVSNNQPANLPATCYCEQLRQNVRLTGSGCVDGIRQL